VLRRVWGNLWQRRQPLIALVGNLSYRNNVRLNRRAYADFKRQWAGKFAEESAASPLRAEAPRVL
jgi:hypothetical protein